MTKKKNAFLTFIFSLLPGAAEMYMGFMKMGLSLMGVFFGLAILGSFFGQGIFLIADVVVWFYGFFHAHNLRVMDDEDFYALEDDYIFHLDGSGQEFWNKVVAARYRKLAAAALILIGVSILWNNLLDLLYNILPEFIREYIYVFSYRIPQIILGVAIIVAGVWMIRGKKQEILDEKEAEEDGRQEDTGREDSENA